MSRKADIDAAQKPAVLMIANYPRSTGYAWWFMEALWGEIAESAENNGWRTVVGYPPDESDADRVSPTDADAIEAFLSNGTVADLPAVARRVRRLRLRTIYLSDRPFRGWKYAALRVLGIRRIVVHDHTPGDRPVIGGVKGLAKRMLNRIPLVTADLAVSISPLMYERHRLNARIPACHCTTVTNGIDPKPVIGNARARLLQDHGLPDDAFVIGGVGRLNPYKRYDFAIEVMAELVRRNPAMRPVLLLMGDGPDRDRLQALAGELGVSDRLVLPGKVDDVWPSLCGIDLFLHPSQGEGLSLAVLEAMAAEKPVVVPDIPTVAQTIRNDVDGLVYPDGDLDAAVACLERLHADPGHRRALGRSARRRVIDEFNLEHTYQAFRERVIPTLLLRE